MFLHAGNRISVKKEDIIGIFDLDSASLVKTTRDFLTRAEKEGRVKNVSNELPKSFILTAENKKQKKDAPLYISPISAQTLTERCRDSTKSK